jgi:peptidoglycan/LPS O-acetylase OafA/YrhL
MPCRADALLLGALCAWMVRQQVISQLLANRTKTMYAAFIILLVGAAVMTIQDIAFIPKGWPNLGYTWLALLYTCFLLIAVTEKRGFIKTITMNSQLRRLGMIAYGVYLFHQGILGLAHGLILHQVPIIHNIQDLMVTIFALALTLALANLSWIFFEKPLVALGHNLHYQTAAGVECAPTSIRKQKPADHAASRASSDPLGTASAPLGLS